MAKARSPKRRSDSQLPLALSGKTDRRSDRPEPDEERLVWLLLTLVRRRRVGFREWYAKFELSSRTFDRDVAKLNDLGKRHAFRLTRRDGTVALNAISDVADPARRADDLAADALHALVDALGDVIGSSLRGYVDFGGGPFDRFLRFATPRLQPTSDVAALYAQLRDAWSRRAAVRFRYPANDGSGTTERVVEPYLVSYNAGRYYAIGFDTHGRRGGWRQYALDRIEGPIRVAGTFVPKAIPPAYAGEDAVGLFKRGIGSTRVPSVYVTFELSDVIAASVVARTWQRDQHVEREDGRVRISFVMHDIGEAVRWAFGFGREARIVAPPEAVDLARRTAAALSADYFQVAESSITA